MSGEDWRDAYVWTLVEYDHDYFSGDRKPPMRPPEEAELAQPDSWASLYAGRKLVATWARGHAVRGGS